MLLHGHYPRYAAAAAIRPVVLEHNYQAKKSCEARACFNEKIYNIKSSAPIVLPPSMSVDVTASAVTCTPVKLPCSTALYPSLTASYAHLACYVVTGGEGRHDQYRGAKNLQKGLCQKCQIFINALFLANLHTRRAKKHRGT